MSAEPTLRPLRPGELPAFRSALDLAFHDQPSPPGSEERWTRVLDFARTVAAFDGDELIGTSGAYARRLSVPGGELPCAGITVVTVRPTHRRRGLLRRMMSELLAQAVAAGEPLAALWAAEGGIYGRFGFGVASWRTTVRLPGGGPPPQRDGQTPPSVRLVPFASADPAPLDGLWERVRAQRPGIPRRSRAWWEVRVLVDHEQGRDGALEKRLVVAHDGDGAPQGYAIYRVRRAEPRATLDVLELVAPDAEADAALWAYVCAVDLVDAVHAPMRPVDDPVVLRFADARQAAVGELADGIWLRVLDLPAAIAGRAWAAPADVVLRLDDAQLPANAGTWRIETSADGDGRATPTDRAPDLVLDVATLGAAYLGGTPLLRLASAGRVREQTPGAVERLDAALPVARAPWTPEFF